MVTQIAVDKHTGRAMGVHYVTGGRERFQRARMVAVAGYSIETPRLLLNSASSRFPDGLCNDFDQVGRYLMVQGAPQTAGRFDAEVRMYKAPPPEVSTEAFYGPTPARSTSAGSRSRPSRPCRSPGPSTSRPRGTGAGALREYMSDYVHWSCMGALCEFLPLPENRVTLADEKDSYGLPVARFSYSQCDNDRALARAAQSVMEDILEYSAPTHAFKMVPSSIGVDWPTAVPGDAAIARAAEILNAGQKVAIVAGLGRARGTRGTAGGR